MDLRYCKEDSPPTRAADPSVKHLCEIKCQFDVPFKELPLRTSKTGIQFRRYDFNVTMTTEHASLQFALMIGGRKQGGKSVQVEFEDGYSLKTMEEILSRMAFVD
jgi:hypothetical protein